MEDLAKYHYMIDGITITDVYDGNASISVNKNSIEEMQVISGAFNAEYGHAMSGIVNIITKEGSNQTSGNLSTYLGDFSSKHSSLFLNIDDIDPFSTSNMDLSVNGPILKDKLFYFTNFRSIRYEGIHILDKKYIITITYHILILQDHLFYLRPEIIDGDSTYPGLGSKEYVSTKWIGMKITITN